MGCVAECRCDAPRGIACQRSPQPRDEYAASVSWDRLAGICGQFLSKGQLVDIEGRLQTRQWDDDAGKAQ